MQEDSFELTVPWIAPEDVFVDLAGDGGDLFWLDSGDDGVSFIGTGERVAASEVERVVARAPGTASPWDGGWVGWLDFEYGARAMGVRTAVDPSPRWIRATNVVAFDPRAGVVRVRGTQVFLDRVVAVRTAPPGASAPELGDARALITPAEHAARVEACREAIRDGDAYQLCLTTGFIVEGVHDDVATYRRLRHAAPSHHGGFIRIGDLALLSISPEQFLGAADGVLSTKPIKGTRPRGASDAEDAALAAELAADEKERAENVMIVDLMRNDLSRVCEPGTVAVPSLWSVETYPTVHQLVSCVTGTLRDGLTVGDVWRATFPAGSMTGAPKLSAMTILERLEGAPRGVYAGCFGWVGPEGHLDLAMVIRSIVVGPTFAHVGSGGGITWGSRPDFEVAEVGIKARVPLAALGSRCPAGW